MIPTVILAGLLVGRWWAAGVAAVVWPVVLVSTHVMELETGLVAAAALAAANAAVGITLHRLALVLFRAVRASAGASRSP